MLVLNGIAFQMLFLNLKRHSLLFKKNLKFEGLKKNLQINISPCQEVNFLKNALSQGWASLMAQLVKNPPAMWETWV